MWRCASRRVQLRPSYQTDLKGASAPVWPRRAEDSVTHYRIGQSFTVMLEAPLIVRVVVPATPAHPGGRGRRDAFGQYGTVRSGLLAGALLMEDGRRACSLAFCRNLMCVAGHHEHAALRREAEGVAAFCSVDASPCRIRDQTRWREAGGTTLPIVRKYAGNRRSRMDFLS